MADVTRLMAFMVAKLELRKSRGYTSLPQLRRCETKSRLKPAFALARTTLISTQVNFASMAGKSASPADPFRF